MPELRWNPLMKTWTMVAANRQNRPHLPSGQCPFYPGGGKVPAEFTVMAYPNDFPVLSTNPEQIKSELSKPYTVKEAYGVCEVLLYTPNHDIKFYELSINHIAELVGLWSERYVTLSKDSKIKYIYIFENKGVEVGVTIHHPHGQLYAYSWVPQKIKEELDNSKEYYQHNGTVLMDDIVKAEVDVKHRIVFENQHFVSYIPHFTDYPFGVFISSKRSITNVSEFTIEERISLAEVLQSLTAGFDFIYDRPFPYMMCMHQVPVNEAEYEDASKYYRWHIEFYPPLRSADKIKWYAGSEMGAGAAANPLLVEDCAEMLRNAILKAKSA